MSTTRPWKSEDVEDDATLQSQNKDDTIDPRKWPNSKRRRAAVSMGVFAFLEPFASSMIAPSLPLIAEEFGITSSVERNVSVSRHSQMKHFKC